MGIWRAKSAGRVRRVLWVLSLVVAAGLVGAFAAVAATGLSPQPRTTFDFLQVRGNCDEPEHAVDPGCAGSPQQEDRPSVVPVPASPPAPVPSGAGDAATGDVRGPCDEAEHAGDPRCTGVQEPEDPLSAAPSPTASAVSPSPTVRGRDEQAGSEDERVDDGGRGPGHNGNGRSDAGRRGPEGSPGHNDDGSRGPGAPGGSGAGRGRGGGDD